MGVQSQWVLRLEESLVAGGCQVQEILGGVHLGQASDPGYRVEQRVEVDQAPAQCAGQVRGDQGAASCGQVEPHCGQDTG